MDQTTLSQKKLPGTARGGWRAAVRPQGIAPTGQYDPAKLVNLGSNRWTSKPELGLSRAFGGDFALDAYGSLWFFTENPEFFSNNPERRPSGSPATSR